MAASCVLFDKWYLIPRRAIILCPLIAKNGAASTVHCIKYYINISTQIN